MVSSLRQDGLGSGAQLRGSGSSSLQTLQPQLSESARVFRAFMLFWGPSSGLGVQGLAKEGSACWKHRGCTRAVSSQNMKP